MKALNIATAPKTETFQMTINPEIKNHLEVMFAKSGMSLTDAINCFLQQSINVGGLPFIMTQNRHEAQRNLAIAQLMTEIHAGHDSVKTENDWVSEKEMMGRFGVQL